MRGIASYSTEMNYKCEFNRGNGWASVGRAGFEGVCQVVIDEDWSALRFRRVEKVKKMKRDPARSLTSKGTAPSARRNLK